MERETFDKRIAILNVIIAPLAALIVLLVTGEFYIAAITFFSLLLDLAFAEEFGGIAAEKGYSYKKYVIWCYIFTAIGYLMVIALPDRGKQSAGFQQESKSNSVHSTMSAKTSTPSTWVPTITATSENKKVCPSCGHRQASTNYVCTNCGETLY